MRKYNQRLLLLTSVVSLILFLIYRHEYNRLHYVLEVFNFFGQQPCNITDIEDSNNALNHHDWGPSPYWQNNDDFYTYSSHYYEERDARTIVLSRTDTEVLPKNCYLHYENKKKPTVGKFKYSKLTEETNLINDHVGYFYHCYGTIKEKPYAVSFTKRNLNNNVKSIPVNVPREKKIFNTTVCLYVNNEFYTKESLFEFISYHTLIGAESYVIYANNVPHRITKLLTNFQTRLGIQIAFLIWNYPQQHRPSLERNLIENDCLLRTLHESNHVVVLEPNEYVVPINGKSLNDVLETTSDRLLLPIEEFCIDSFRKNVPIALQNFRYKEDGNNVQIVYNNVMGTSNVISTGAVDRNVAKIHRYGTNCEPSTKLVTDKSMMRYYTEFVRSTLVQLIVHNKL